jgi:ADP-ribose pyrophosphatase
MVRRGDGLAKTDLSVALGEKELLWQHPQDFLSLYRVSYDHDIIGSSLRHQSKHIVVDKAPACMVLPYDPVCNTVLLIEQVRSGPVFSGETSSTTFEICGGVVEDGEKPGVTARRELMEEAGLEARVLEKVMSWWVTPDWSTEMMHLYCAYVSLDESIELFHSDGDSEAARSVVLSVDDFISALDQGRLDTASVIIAAQWFARHHQEVRARWRSKSV